MTIYRNSALADSNGPILYFCNCRNQSQTEEAVEPLKNVTVQETEVILIIIIHDVSSCGYLCSKSVMNLLFVCCRKTIKARALLERQMLLSKKKRRLNLKL